MPYLSVVATARNDDYGGNFLQRMQHWANTWLELGHEEHLELEVIVVEWNPPPDAPRLHKDLIWPRVPASQDLSVRFIEVPSVLHHAIPNADKMPLFEYIAKNAGVRRARGRFVLCTNPDVLPSRELVRFLAARRLAVGHFYRMDRWDVDLPVPPHLSPQAREDFCYKHRTRVHTQWGSYRTGQVFPAEFVARMIAGLQQLAGLRDPWFRLHCNASGDFCLMAAEDWRRVRGYPELPTHSHIDSYLCLIAATTPLKQVVLREPIAIFHQEHDRSVHATRPLTDLAEVAKRAREMQRRQKSLQPNNTDWGLAGRCLPETAITLPLC